MTFHRTSREQVALIAQTDKLDEIMCAEVGQGTGDHVKICNRLMRDTPPNAQQFHYLTHIPLA
jgi:hypothetical protein